MKERKPQGQSIRVDPLAESANPSLPAFIAIPKGAPAYHGFPLLAHSEKEGFYFGVITEPNGETPASWGDAFVVAPDGSRAGIVWQAEGEPSPVVCPPSPGRWGVYAFRFRRPVRNEQDLIENLHEVLPQLKAFYAAALIDNPESTNVHQPQIVDVTPGWKFVSIGFEKTPVAIQGIDPWRHDQQWVSSNEKIVVSHPRYPSERHTMFVYQLEIDGRAIKFAAGEFSNGVWGFYEPA
jgi:hypothetical protein